MPIAKLLAFRQTNMISQCKSVKQLHQVHAYTITTGLLILFPSPIFSSILSTFTSILLATSSTYGEHSSTSTSLSYAISVFNSIPNPTTFSYNNLIRLQTLFRYPVPAVQCFASLRRFSVLPDFHTFPFVFKACAQLRSFSLAQSVHSQAFKFGFLPDLFVVNSLVRVYSVCDRIHDAYQVFCESSVKDVVSYNAMIDGFVKSRQILRARELFDFMPAQDAVSWGTMIAGYSQANLYNEAIELLNKMVTLGLRPDNIALVSVLSACAQLGELEQGRTVHDYIKRNGIKVDNFLATGLVDLYAKCGCVEIARDTFESSPDKNVFTWNALLVGLAMHGKGSLLLDYFSRMITEGIQPDGVSLLGVLVGCSHAGLVHEARKLFNDMETVYRVPRELKHYGCMADMLGRAGLIEEAMEMIKGMPSEGDVCVWGALLAGCRIHGNIEIAKKAAEQVMELKPDDGGVYSIMANMYAHKEQWDDLVKIRKSLSANRRVKKISGSSLIRLSDVARDPEFDAAHKIAILN